MTPTTQDAELLPCPFCGGPPTLHRGMVAFTDVEIHCDDCSMVGPNFDEQKEMVANEAEAIAAWNTRAAPSQPSTPQDAGLIERARVWLSGDSSGPDNQYAIMRALADRLEALSQTANAEPEGWRGIESAPKDGVAVLTFGNGASWSGGYAIQPAGEAHRYPWERVTHWMPLPPAPDA
jgi:Lar family restriction alleviation protein